MVVALITFTIIYYNFSVTFLVTVPFSIVLESSDEGGNDEETGDEETGEEETGWKFLDSRNSFFLLSFLLLCEGEIFLMMVGVLVFSMVSIKKEKVDPTLIENVKENP